MTVLKSPSCCRDGSAWRASAPVDMLGPEEEGVIVIGDHAVHEPLRVQPGALRLGFGGRDDVGQAEQLQQLLAVLVHVAGGRVIDARLLAVVLLQALHTHATVPRYLAGSSRSYALESWRRASMHA